MKKKLNQDFDIHDSKTKVFKENEKLIRDATIYCIAHSTIVVGLIIAFIYCKIKGI